MAERAAAVRGRWVGKLCLLAVALSRPRGAPAEQQRDIWLIGIVPFTGFDWDAGGALRFGAEMMLEDIAAQGALLPGYRLRIVWQDERCSGSFARDLLLQNAIDGKYFSFGDWPHTDSDGDGLIYTEESLLGQQIWGSSEIPEPPIAIFGGGCSGASMALSTVAYRFRLPIISPGSSNSALSDRAAYPNFFRTIGPDAGYLKGWCTLLRALGVNSMFPVVGETAIFKVNLIRLVEYAAQFQINLVGTDLGSEVPGLKGFQLSSDSWSGALEFAATLRQTTVRTVGVMLYDMRFRLALCAAARSGLWAHFWLGGAVTPAGFWSREDHTQISGVEWCTKETLAVMGQGFIQANVAFWRSDLSAALSCSSHTAGEFKTAFYTDQNAPVGSDTSSDRGYYVMGEGACAADAVCMYARALHELLVARGRPLSDLQARNRSAYDEIFDVLSRSDFEGLQGRLKYEPGVAEPDSGVTFTQVQLPRAPCLGMEQCGASATDVKWVLVGTQAPDSPDIDFVRPMMFHYSDEVYPAAGVAASPGEPLADFLDCPAGMVYDLAARQCAGCPENKTYFESTGSCLCNRGFFGAGQCELCGPGSFSAALGTLHCKGCPKGTFSREGGTSECTRCPKGTFASAASSSDCWPCPAGTTTAFLGAAGPEECVCEEATRMVGGACEACPEGMICALGEQEVKIALGYNAGEDLEVWRCFGVAARCPGGLPGRTCAEGRRGIACAECLDGWAAQPAGECKPCTASHALPVVAFALAAVLVVVALYYLIDRHDHSTQGGAVFIMGNTLSLMITVLRQQLSIISFFAISWPEPMRSLMAFMSFFSLDLEVLEISCVTGSSAPLSDFAVRLMLIFMGFFFIGVTHCIFMAVARGGRFKERMPSLICGLGTIMLVVYISVLSSVIGPLRCLENPNGRQTVHEYQSVVCWEGGGEHPSMVAVGLVAMLGPVAFLAWCALAIHCFPLEMQEGNSEYLRTYAFLFLRFRPDAYWFAMVPLLRSLLFALVSIIPSVVAQILLFQSVACSYVLLTGLFQPWRVRLANVLDVGMNVAVIMLLSTTAFFVSGATLEPIAWCGTAIVLCILVWALLVLFYGAVRYLVPKRFGRPFSHFLCHHKAGCGSFARHQEALVWTSSLPAIFLPKVLNSTVTGLICKALRADSLAPSAHISEMEQSQRPNKVLIVADHSSMEALNGGHLVEQTGLNLHLFETAVNGATKDVQSLWRTLLKLWMGSSSSRLVEFAEASMKGISSTQPLALTSPLKGETAHESGLCRPCVFHLRGICRNTEEMCLYCHAPGHMKTKRASMKVRRRQKAKQARTPSPASRRMDAGDDLGV